MSARDGGTPLAWLPSTAVAGMGAGTAALLAGGWKPLRAAQAARVTEPSRSQVTEWAGAAWPVCVRRVDGWGTTQCWSSMRHIETKLCMVRVCGLGGCKTEYSWSSFHASHRKMVTLFVHGS